MMKEVSKMSQVVTVEVRIYATRRQDAILKRMGKTYIQTANRVVANMVASEDGKRWSSKDIDTPLPSAVKNQLAGDAVGIYKKARKEEFKRIPVLKKPVCVWNNQNYSFDFESISFPVWMDGKSVKMRFRAAMVDKDNRNTRLLANKLGTLRVTKKGRKWIAQISVHVPTVPRTGVRVMGVDLGLKVPAVAVTDDDTTRFFGNGRKNKYMKRKFRAERKALGKKKKPKAIKRRNQKEQRWMRDKDHKVSRAIVDFARQKKISVIRLELLANIRQTARTSRKNNQNLHSWSFYRLASFIEYKAALSGIKVEYVNPAYTSQTCPSCSVRNKVRDRVYTCACGFKGHRDAVGAMNIRYAPVMDGNSPSA